jgi:hypothetical protein
MMTHRAVLCLTVIVSLFAFSLKPAVSAEKKRAMIFKKVYRGLRLPMGVNLRAPVCSFVTSILKPGLSNMSRSQRAPAIRSSIRLALRVSAKLDSEGADHWCMCR